MSDSLWPHGLYTVHGIPQAKILEWVAFPFSKGSSQTQGSNPHLLYCRRFFTSWATELLKNPESALRNDEDRKSIELVSSCFSLPQYYSYSILQIPLWGSPNAQQTWANRSPSTVSTCLFMTLCFVAGNKIFTLRYTVNPGWWGSWLAWKCSCSCNQSAQPTNPAQVTLTGSTTYHHKFHGEHWT